MKKFIYFLILLVFAFTSCEQDEIIDPTSNQEEELIGTSLKSKKGKVTICHKGKIITVNGNALTAHLNHGDVQLIDADGDGWVSFENECVPGGDCDDTDANVNPGTIEIPYNGKDDDCDPVTLDDDLDEDGFLNADDCDDTNADVNPGADEVCENDIDDNCNGEVDEGCEACSDCEFGEILNSIDLTTACFRDIDYGDGVAVFTFGQNGDFGTFLVVYSTYYEYANGPVSQSGNSSQGCLNCFIDFLEENNVPECVDELEIGDIHEGGIVCFLWDGGLHGFVAAPYDLESEDWEDANRKIDDLVIDGYDDWQLADKDFLFNFVWPNLADSDGDGYNSGIGDPNNLGNFQPMFYWSSTEDYPTGAWAVDFKDGRMGRYGKSLPFLVRPIRAF